MSDSDALKAEANALFAKEEYLKSASVYSRAIKVDPQNAVLYSNRSAALLKLKKVTKALEDAEMCISLRSDWEKGYFRKAAVLEEMERYDEALAAYQDAQKMNPESKDLVGKIREMSKLASRSGRKAS